MLDRLRTTVAVLGVIALFVCIVLALTWKRPAAPVGPAPIVAVTPATTASSNAADSYREAVKLYQAMQRSGDSSQFDRYADGAEFGPGADALFVRHGGIVQYVRSGAGAASFDWGEQEMQERMKSLNGLRGAARFTMLHARYARQIGKDPAAASEDLLAAMALGRHIGTQPLLIDKLVEVSIESQAIDALARLLPELPRETLDALGKKLDSLAKSATGQQMLKGEFENARKEIRRQEAGFVMTQMVEAMEPFYRDLGTVIDSQSPAEFAKSVDAEMSKFNLNTFAQNAGPSLKRAREPLAVVETKLAMLHTAIGVLLDGESAVAKSRDPFGGGAPFTYSKKAGNGFELTSSLSTPKDGPVKLRVGEGGAQ
ncbi:MAG TPA: hypothetical protein VH518_22575 [Tepidisphaeraceae bacterium]|jgi:hypothetical protein